MFAVAAVMATFTGAVAQTAASAQSLTPAHRYLIADGKTDGIVGEQADGYVGFRLPSSDHALHEAVTLTNQNRRVVYQTQAREAATTLEAVVARNFTSLRMSSISQGYWYRDERGQWIQPRSGS